MECNYNNYFQVPILRIKFNAPFADITVDLNANNSVAIRNTHLLCYYSSCKLSCIIFSVYFVCESLEYNHRCNGCDISSSPD